MWYFYFLCITVLQRITQHRIPNLNNQRATNLSSNGYWVFPWFKYNLDKSCWWNENCCYHNLLCSNRKLMRYFELLNAAHVTITDWMKKAVFLCSPSTHPIQWDVRYRCGCVIIDTWWVLMQIQIRVFVLSK